MPVTALCKELDEKASQWVQILPSGPDIKGLDGRSWVLRNPKAILHAFHEMKVPMVIDYEHGQELKATKGEEAPAAGWIEELEIRNGEIWAKADWTKKAASAINSREYRFLSPAFNYNESKEVISLSSVGLTNKPNLVMQALNSRQNEPDNKWEKLSKALGSNVTSDDELLSALNSRDSQAEKKEIESLVDGYVSDAVFTPAQRDFLVACCRSQGIDEFKKFAGSTSGFSYLNKSTNTPHKTKQNSSSLNETQLAVCRNVGISEEQFLNVKNKEV
ncbi:hypothetical protein EKN09_12795 [Vibrio penaeicida]|uniref:Mu phage protease GpI n=1 Tax=Vibrio penaeicida TaxID=104609 RepID=A0AAV5NT87_9VIBR|nr:phage protease [Vibrio penaeicida]RTZ22692.1 hypothetical protein EKN09_12795 [Vibrio penaeicida]GLQ73544.1 Mu phage protease GpI [Vibrio penaeicida]